MKDILLIAIILGYNLSVIVLIGYAIFVLGATGWLILAIPFLLVTNAKSDGQ